MEKAPDFIYYRTSYNQLYEIETKFKKKYEDIFGLYAKPSFVTSGAFYTEEGDLFKLRKKIMNKDTYKKKEITLKEFAEKLKKSQKEAKESEKRRKKEFLENLQKQKDYEAR